MVCVAHELRCECIVRDITQSSAKFEVTLPASTSVQELFSQVADKMKYEPNSFQLTFQAKNTVLTEESTGSLEAVGFSTIPGSRNSLVLEGIGGNTKNLVVRSPTNEERTVTSPTPPEHINFQMPAIRPATASPATEYTFPTPVIRHETGYVGLVNQAMTCYLNSLLQALFMTPEFRNALYKWKFDPDHGSGPNKCIPFQLQKLFLNLQTSTKTAVETTELTRSFGWESGEVWQQHDIQELCRVMFDALEQEFKETEQADLINQLYQGKMIDYVKCLECNSEKSREDTFLDIPLPVRPFGSTIAYASIEEALRAFVQPETLDGNNQYLCDKCEKKCDAHKGLKFTKFPYLLTLHLKRFDFDYNTMHRIKLNDKVVFPEVLNLNSFVNSNIINEADCEAQENSFIKNDDASIADSVLDEDTSNAVEMQNNEIDQEEDEGIDVNSGNNHENEKNRQQSGPFIYELYSIMIHSGSASGGHYYAYIKDFAKNEWYCFNDQTVTSITLEDIKKTYGGTGGSARGYYSGAYSSSTNAYMLMYRQINNELNCYAMTEEEFPPHIKKLLEDLKEAEEREKAIKAKQDEMVRIKLYANHPILGQPRNEKMYCPNDMTVGEVKAMAYRQLKLEGIVSPEQCRLVLYNKSHDEMEESWDERDKDLIGDLLTFTNKFCYNCELLMEIREKNKKFLPYSVGDIRLTVYVYDGEERGVGGPEEIRTSPCQTLSQLKKLLQDYMQLKTDELHIVLVKPASLLYISDDNLPLNRQGFTSGNFNKIFISYRGQEGDLTDKFEESELYKQLDEVKNVITLQISVPDTKKETLELLLIPPLTESGVGDGDKPSDSTPTGEGLPLMNGIQEEELGYGSGAGMSDQSASEDSSLTDSDRTIIGEVVNECPLSSPSDSDQQLSSSDSQTVGKLPIILNNDKKSNLENNDNTCQASSENDESNIWNPESTRYYFRATPYTTEEGQEMLRIVVDKATDVNILKEKLEKFLGVDCKYMKLLKGPDAQEISSLRSCRDDEKVTIKLERVLSDGEHRIGVNHLVVNAPAPVRHICDWIVSDGDSIASLKKALLKEVEKRASLKIPYERCRLRKQTCKNPGAVLLDSEVWDEGLQQEVYLQELEGPDPVSDPSQTLIFTRRWCPGKTPQTLEPFQEIIIDSNNSTTSLSKRLSEISGIPVENVKFAKGKLPFPGESVVQLNDLNWESDYDNSSKLLMNDWERENGAVAFYRDDREEIKNLKEERQGDGSQESNTTSNTFSYISGYSPRKERALKIYRETPRRNPRSVIDVD